MGAADTTRSLVHHYNQSSIQGSYSRAGETTYLLSSRNDKIFKFDCNSSAWRSIGCSLFKLFTSILAINNEKKGIELQMWNFPIITLKIGMYCYICGLILLNSTHGWSYNW